MNDVNDNIVWSDKSNTFLIYFNSHVVKNNARMSVRILKTSLNSVKSLLNTDNKFLYEFLSSLGYHWLESATQEKLREGLAGQRDLKTYHKIPIGGKFVRTTEGHIEVIWDCDAQIEERKENYEIRIIRNNDLGYGNELLIALFAEINGIEYILTGNKIKPRSNFCNNLTDTIINSLIIVTINESGGLNINFKNNDTTVIDALQLTCLGYFEKVDSGRHWIYFPSYNKIDEFYNEEASAWLFKISESTNGTGMIKIVFCYELIGSDKSNIWRGSKLFHGCIEVPFAVDIIYEVTVTGPLRYKISGGYYGTNGLGESYFTLLVECNEDRTIKRSCWEAGSLEM